MDEIKTDPSSSGVELLPTRNAENSSLSKVFNLLDIRSAERPIPKQIGPYVILRELGQGGMGIVYLARHETLNRVVALKMILSSVAPSQRVFDRFRTEAVAVARLQHPNIVQLYEIGETDGAPYCVLEYVAGGSLYALMSTRPPTPEQAARVIETLAIALETAHRNGIIHRDLKPGNVLLSPVVAPNEPPTPFRPSAKSQAATKIATPIPSLQDGKIVGWGVTPFVPKVADFGLAKVLDMTSEPQTRTGDVLGTPQYMSPEQAMGDTSQIGPATDIWALGAILYEMLTGRTPFRGETPIDTMLMLLNEEPIPPSRLKNKLAADLETICLKCLEKKPENRYRSAQDLANDLHAFQEGNPILARPIPLRQQIVRWARRHRTLAALILAISVSIALVVGLTVRYNWTLTESLSQTESARLQAIESRDAERRASQDAIAARGEAIERRQVAERLNEDLKKQIAIASAERERAEGNFERARTAVQEMLGVAGQEWIAQVPQLEEVRRELLERALRFQQQFLLQKQDDPAIRFEVARAYQQVGELQARLGRAQEAEAAYLAARTLLADLVQANAHNRDWLREQGLATFKLALFYRDQGRDADMDRELNLARDQQSALRASGASDPLILQDLARTHNALGQQHLERADYLAAQADYATAQSMQEDLVRSYPEHSQKASFLEDLAGTINDAGRLARKQNRLVDARESFLSASMRWKQLVEAHPKVAGYRQKYATTLNNIGLIDFELALAAEGDARKAGLKRAEKSIREAMEYRGRLTVDFRGVPTYRHEFAISWGSLANILALLDDTTSANRAYETAAAIEKSLTEDFPSVLDYHHTLGGFLDNWIRSLQQDPQNDSKIRQLLSEAGSHHHQAMTRNPNQAMYRSFQRNHVQISVSNALRMGEPQVVNSIIDLFLHPLAGGFVYPASDYFLAARYRLQAIPIIEQDTKLDLNARKAVIDLTVKKALENLRSAIQGGDMDPKHRAALEQDAVFAPLRKHADYATLRDQWAAKVPALPMPKPE